MALSIDFWKSVKSLFLIYLTWGLYIFYKKLYRKQNLFFKENKSDDIIIDEINSINDNMTTEYDDVNSMIYKLLH